MRDRVAGTAETSAAKSMLRCMAARIVGARRMASSLAKHLQKKGETARTVTTKVRYPDFAIRSRSTSLSVGTDDPDRIGELACGLLDRALDDRPGPLRLVGVGVSGFEPHRQLALV